VAAFHKKSRPERDQIYLIAPASISPCSEAPEDRATPVCTENLIRVDDVMESHKLAE